MGWSSTRLEPGRSSPATAMLGSSCCHCPTCGPSATSRSATPLTCSPSTQPVVCSTSPPSPASSPPLTSTLHRGGSLDGPAWATTLTSLLSPTTGEAFFPLLSN